MSMARTSELEQTINLHNAPLLKTVRYASAHCDQHVKNKTEELSW
jgi:hypothetical protein